MRTIGVNANNDIYRGPDGNLVVLTGLDAYGQGVAQAMRTQRNSVPLDLQYGVDTLSYIWNAYKPAQFIAQARALLGSYPDTVAVQSFDLERLDGVASYTSNLESIYGATVVSATLAQSGANPL